MTTLEFDLDHVSVPQGASHKGPVTARRQRRTAMIYGAVCLIGEWPADRDS